MHYLSKHTWHHHGLQHKPNNAYACGLKLLIYIYALSTYGTARAPAQIQSKNKQIKQRKENSTRINVTDSLCSDKDRSCFAQMRFGRFIMPTFD